MKSQYIERIEVASTEKRIVELYPKCLVTIIPNVGSSTGK